MPKYVRLKNEPGRAKLLKIYKFTNRDKLIFQCWMLDAGCWMLDAGCWMLDAGCWMLDAGCWMLDAGCWAYATHKTRLHITSNFFFESNI
jgi:hypothetical protein